MNEELILERLDAIIICLRILLFFVGLIIGINIFRSRK